MCHEKLPIITLRNITHWSPTATDTKVVSPIRTFKVRKSESVRIVIHVRGVPVTVLVRIVLSPLPIPRSTHLSVLVSTDIESQKGVPVTVLVRIVLSPLPIPRSTHLSLRVSTDSESQKGVPVTVLVRIPGPQCGCVFF